MSTQHWVYYQNQLLHGRAHAVQGASYSYVSFWYQASTAASWKFALWEKSNSNTKTNSAERFFYLYTGAELLQVLDDWIEYQNSSDCLHLRG